MITKFDRQNLKELSAEIEIALATIAKKHGINIELTNGSFNSDSYSCRIKAATKASQEFNLNAVRNLGEQPIIANVTRFRFNTSTFTVIKVDMSRPKYKVLAQNSNGTRYWFPVDLVNKGRI